MQFLLAVPAARTSCTSEKARDTASSDGSGSGSGTTFSYDVSDSLVPRSKVTESVGDWASLMQFLLAVPAERTSCTSERPRDTASGDGDGSGGWKRNYLLPFL